jgi:hypothetical protein
MSSDAPCQTGPAAQTRKPPARRIGTPIPGPGRIGKRGFPVSRPNRETGIPSPGPFPGKNTGNGGSDSRFPSDVRASTAVDSEYTQPRVSCQCSHRQHAAPIQGPREGTCSCHLSASRDCALKVTSSGSRNLPVAQPGTDVMRDVLRLVDVDPLSLGRHRPKSPSHSPPSPRPSRHPPSAGP